MEEFNPLKFEDDFSEVILWAKSITLIQMKKSKPDMSFIMNAILDMLVNLTHYHERILT